MSVDTSTPDRPDDAPSTDGPRANRVVFVAAATGIIAVTLWAAIVPAQAETVLGVVVGWISDWFGWFYLLLATAVLVFVVVLAVSRYGKIKLGPEHSQPEYRTFTWASMLFAAGIGTDLMFFAVAEPATQYLAPPSTPPESVDAAREATVWTMFHYGLNGWGMYALMGMALAYFAYRMNLPLAVRSSLRPIFGRRVEGRLGDAVDTAAVLGTMFGVATTLGIGVVQLNFGLNMLFGVPQGVAAQIGLVVLAVVMAAISAFSGIDRGIKRLSQLNVLLAIGLSLWILVSGRTSFLLDAIVLNVGDFVRLFPDMTLQTFAFEDTGDWMSSWTLFFWAWWVAWASFIGLFLARISRGRTIRQFVAGCLFIPFSYILMWVGIFGNSAVDMIRQGDFAFGQLAMNTPEAGFYTLLTQYPGFSVTAALATIVGLLFYVTSADSGALVMANLSSRLPSVRHDGSPALRVFWAAATGALTLALLAVGGVQAMQYATIVTGLPFAFVMVLVMVGLYRALRVEAHMVDARSGTPRRAASGRDDTSDADPDHPAWHARLRQAMSFPGVREAEQYLDGVVRPALAEVADEMAEQGVTARVGTATDDEGRPGIELDARLEEADDQPFVYCVTVHEAPTPSYGRAADGGDASYGRLEVHLRDGGQGYDVMGSTKEQLIDDVLDSYERHLEFLRRHADARS